MQNVVITYLANEIILNFVINIYKFMCTSMKYNKRMLNFNIAITYYI